jgi:hypothetical protein
MGLGINIFGCGFLRRLSRFRFGTFSSMAGSAGLRASPSLRSGLG